MRFEIWDKVKSEECCLINVFSIHTANTRVSLISITNSYNMDKSFTLLNITIITRTIKVTSKEK